MKLMLAENIRPCSASMTTEFEEGEPHMEDEKKTVVKKTVKSGVTFGSALAMVISYTAWHSIGWAIFHGLLSWAYVVYYIIRY